MTTLTRPRIRVDKLLFIWSFWGVLSLIIGFPVLSKVLQTHWGVSGRALWTMGSYSASLEENQRFFTWLENYGTNVTIGEPSAPAVNRSSLLADIPVDAFIGENPSQDWAFNICFRGALRYSNSRFFPKDPVPPPYLDFFGFPLIPVLPRDELKTFFPTLPEKSIEMLPTISIADRSHVSFGLMYYMAEFLGASNALKMSDMISLIGGILLGLIITALRYWRLTEEELEKGTPVASIALIGLIGFVYMVAIPSSFFDRRSVVGGFTSIGPARFDLMQSDFKRYAGLLREKGFLSDEELDHHLSAIPEAPPR